MANTRGKRKETLPVDEVMEKNPVVEETAEPETKAAPKPKAPFHGKGTVNCKNLNVRKAPAMGATILQIIPEGTVVEILSDVNDTWYKVRVGNIESGFCMKEFITAAK